MGENIFAGCTMTVLNCTLLNFAHAGILCQVFESYSRDFEYTMDGIFRRIVPPVCPVCKNSLEESRGFWEELKSDFFWCYEQHLPVFADSERIVSGCIGGVGAHIFRGKDTVHNDFTDSVEKAYISPIEDVQILHYDEQHPEIGRAQKFRLTLLDGVSSRPIADELYDRRDPDTIKTFFEAHLDPTGQIFVVTDFYSSYPGVFGEFNGCEPDSSTLSPPPEQTDSG